MTCSAVFFIYFFLHYSFFINTFTHSSVTYESVRNIWASFFNVMDYKSTRRKKEHNKIYTNRKTYILSMHDNFHKPVTNYNVEVDGFCFSNFWKLTTTIMLIRFCGVESRTTDRKGLQTQPLYVRNW